MKRILFIILSLAASPITLMAQDTLHIAGPKDNYYSKSWLDSASFCRWEDRNGYMYPGDAVAKFFQTGDSLEIYGVAAILLTPWDDFDGDTATLCSMYLDTSRANCLSIYRLYQYDSSSSAIMVPIGDDLPVFATDPVTYYIDMGMPGPYPMSLPGNERGSQFPPYPVYERYYSAPQAVCGTFYLGINFYQDWSVNNYGQGALLYSHLPFYLPLFIPSDSREWKEEYAAHYIQRDPATEKIDSTWLFFQNSPGYMFIFPIITPPDTTTTPDDTTGVGLRQNDLIYRYTTLQPNPATDRVRVLSSFGITAIEAYDLRGRLVKKFSIPKSQLSINLDVSSWPRGTYLLRILTPAGPTTKKLLIQ